MAQRGPRIRDRHDGGWIQRNNLNMGTEKNITELHNIHDLLVDSRKGYTEASERAEDPRTKELLASFSRERGPLEAEVDALLKQLEPEATHRDGGTLKGDLHRAWMDLRDSLTKSENANVLSECERGEGFLLMRYDEVLEQQDLNPAVRTLSERQRSIVQANLGRIKTLREVFEKIES